MERLTKTWEPNNCVPINIDYGQLLDLSEQQFKEIDKIVRKLAEYEDLGLTPQQLKEIDKLYLEKCQEVNSKNEMLSKLQSAYDNLKEAFHEVSKCSLDCGDCQWESGDGCGNCIRNSELPEDEKEVDNYYHEESEVLE